MSAALGVKRLWAGGEKAEGGTGVRERDRGALWGNGGVRGALGGGARPCIELDDEAQVGLRERKAEAEGGESKLEMLPVCTVVVCGWAGLEEVLLLWVVLFWLESERRVGSDETDDPPCCWWDRLLDSPFRRGGTSCTDSLCRSKWRRSNNKCCIPSNVHLYLLKSDPSVVQLMKYNIQAAPALQTEQSPV